MPTPVVTGVSPPSGPTTGGTFVTITGSGFTGALGVAFGSTPATSFAVNSDTQIQAVSPPHVAGTVDVKVGNSSGVSGAVLGDQFLYAAAVPAVAHVFPASGPTSGGTQVMITGSNFTGATAVTFGGVSASFTVNAATQITAVAPAHTAGTVDVLVATPNGTSVPAQGDQFLYTAAVPTVVSVAPASGPAAGGTFVTITGTNFTGAIGVAFGGTPATSFTVNSATQIVAVSPAHAPATVDVQVGSPDGVSATSAADRFTYGAALCPPASPSSAAG